MSRSKQLSFTRSIIVLVFALGVCRVVSSIHSRDIDDGSISNWRSSRHQSSRTPVAQGVVLNSSGGSQVIRPNESDVARTNSSRSSSLQTRSLYGPGGDDYRVPLWNIAHMINSVKEIEPALSSGANGIEVDVSFDKKGFPAETYHGFPCDCGRHCHYRENFIKYVQHLARITNPPAQSQLLLVLFDLKLKDFNAEQKSAAGRYLASILSEHLYGSYQRATYHHRDPFAQPPVRVVISINHVTDSMLIRSFVQFVRENRMDLMSEFVGFDVGMNDKLTDISSMWDNLAGITLNVWQGDGLTNCANLVKQIGRLKEAISIRNAQGHFRKVYYWTVDVMYEIRSVLRLGLDAILTNKPERVVQVLAEPEFQQRYRLAVAFDDPFAQFWIQPSAWKKTVPTLSEAVETVTNIRETSANFIKGLPDGIAAAIKKVHHSITS